MTRRCIIVWCLVLLAGVASARAGWHSRIATTAGSGVNIEVASPFDHAPTEGYMPCWITISNHSGEARTWTIHCASRSEAPGNQSIWTRSSQTLRVANEDSARLPLLLPLTPSPSGTFFYRPNNIEVTGYAVEDVSVSVPPVNTSGKRPTAFIAMGETLATPIWASLTKDFADRSIDLAGSPVEVALLGADWRGLAGADLLWLTDKEYTALEPDRRLAIRRWVERGGQLSLFVETLDPALRAGLGLTVQADESQPGFGRVKVIAWDGTELPLKNASALIEGVSALHHEPGANDATDWRMTRSVGTIPLNIPFLIGFITLFAILVGPLNLFWLADASRRHRLFWTTPLISVGASLLLVGVILFEDGFGGAGERTMVTLLLPDQKESVIVQEQVTRTGVLTSRRFTSTEDLVLSPLVVKGFSGKTNEQSGRDYAGDWFASRSVQAQRAEAVAPSRAGIQLLNAAAATAGAPPVLVSSIPAALRDISYLDPTGRHWTGGSLRTGGQITLRPDDSSPVTPIAHGSNFLVELQVQVRARRGYFYATAQDAPFIETLPSIRWKRQEAIYLGPVTSAP